MRKFLWCEDSKSGYHFWHAVFGVLFPDFTVETKGSNTRLRKAAEKITADGNEYYLIMDAALDNPDVLRETKRLNACIAGKSNVRAIRLHSFEYALLSFELLEQWIFAPGDPLRDKRQALLNARKLFIRLFSSGGNGADLQAFREAFDAYESKNSEQIAAKLLFEITRNTGFETGKTRLGDCFILSCCERDGRQSDDHCGLDAHRISADEKAKLLVERSVLKEAFEGAGL